MKLIQFEFSFVVHKYFGFLKLLFVFKPTFSPVYLNCVYDKSYHWNMFFRASTWLLLNSFSLFKALCELDIYDTASFIQTEPSTVCEWHFPRVSIETKTNQLFWGCEHNPLSISNKYAWKHVNSASTADTRGTSVRISN